MRSSSLIIGLWINHLSRNSLLNPYKIIEHVGSSIHNVFSSKLLRLWSQTPSTKPPTGSTKAYDRQRRKALRGRRHIGLQTLSRSDETKKCNCLYHTIDEGENGAIVDDALSIASFLLLRGMVFPNPPQCEYMDHVHKLLAPLLRISCIVAHACPRLLLRSFVQPIFKLWGLRIEDLAVLSLLCARVCSEFVLRWKTVVTVSHVSVVNDRETYIKCLTGTDDGDHP